MQQTSRINAVLIRARDLREPHMIVIVLFMARDYHVMQTVNFWQYSVRYVLHISLPLSKMTIVYSVLST